MLGAAGVVVPLSYLFAQALQGSAAGAWEALWRWRNLKLLSNTLLLTAGVLALVTVLAMPIAWLTTRSDLPARRLFTLLCVLPLAIPGYVLAYVLLAAGGSYGTVASVLGFPIPRITGFWGATLALGLYNLPYMYLNLRASMLRLDPRLEEASRSLGRSVWVTQWRVVWPQLKPAYLAGALLVALHVIGDFGVVGLMRYESFSYALYLEYSIGGSSVYAAWLALMLLAVAGVLLLAELRFLRGLRLDPVGAGGARPHRPVRLGWWKWPACAFLVLVVFLGVIGPVATMIYWSLQGSAQAFRSDWIQALWASIIAAAPAAVLATTLAVPIAYLSRRYPSKLSRGLEQSSYLGYAVPPLAFALALIVFTLGSVPAMYQTLAVLIYAYALHFMAEAVGPVRGALFTAAPRLEEASRSLGRGPVTTFTRVTFPLLRPGVAAAMALVFLSAIKELPLTFLLSPPGFHTLALNIWSYTHEAMFAQAAPYALTLVAVSALFVGALLWRGHEPT